MVSGEDSHDKTSPSSRVPDPMLDFSTHFLIPINPSFSQQVCSPIYHVPANLRVTSSSLSPCLHISVNTPFSLSHSSGRRFRTKFSQSSGVLPPHDHSAAFPARRSPAPAFVPTSHSTLGTQRAAPLGRWWKATSTFWHPKNERKNP